MNIDIETTINQNDHESDNIGSLAFLEPPPLKITSKAAQTSTQKQKESALALNQGGEVEFERDSSIENNKRSCE